MPRGQQSREQLLGISEAGLLGSSFTFVMGTAPSWLGGLGKSQDIQGLNFPICEMKQAEHLVSEFLSGLNFIFPIKCL